MAESFYRRLARTRAAQLEGLQGYVRELHEEIRELKTVTAVTFFFGIMIGVVIALVSV